MNFYTDIVTIGSKILFRGFKDGIRTLEEFNYSPHLFVSDPKGDWKTLDNRPVRKVHFDSSKDMRQYQEQYKGVAGYETFGTERVLHQLVYDLFPNDIQFDRSKVNVTTIDIEVASDKGFPHPDEAAHPVISISIKNNIDNTYHVWGLYDYDVDKSVMKEHPVFYYHCADEHELLKKFVSFWRNPMNTPDVVTGWNTRMFDIPYLVNRIRQVVGPSSAKALSPWQKIKGRTITMGFKEHQVYDLYGIQQLDYLDLFKKFGYAYGQQESYKLDHIAHVVLGERKLSYEEHGSLFTLYKEDFQKFIDYNIKDVELVDRLEEKMGLITLAMTMAYRGGVNYADVFGTVQIWDSIIYRLLSREKTAVPSSQPAEKTKYPGAFVKDPHVGLHEWVTSFDLNSLYPNIIVQYNMSPETIIDGIEAGASIESYLEGTFNAKGKDYTVAPNGIMFRKDQCGIIPTVIKQYYNERVQVKNRMLEAKQEYENLQKELAGLS